MGLFSSAADAIFGQPMPALCVSLAEMHEHIQQLAPPPPQPLPDIPLPEHLDAIAAASSAANTPSNNFIREHRDLFDNMRVPPALDNASRDSAKISQFESVPPLMRAMEKATGSKLGDPMLETKLRAATQAIGRNPVPQAPAAPPPQPVMQKLSDAVTQMRTAQSNLSTRLTPLASSAPAKIQAATAAAADTPPFPAEKLAPLASLATLTRLATAMKLDITQPDAIRKMADNLRQLSQLPSDTPPNATAAIPAMMRSMSTVQTHQNVATFFNVDTAGLTSSEFISKVGVPMQPLADYTKQNPPKLTPAQTANAQSWAASAHYMPALKLMQKFDVSKLDLAPLSDVPPIPNFGHLAAILAMGETAQAAAKKNGARDFPKFRLG